MYLGGSFVLDMGGVFSGELKAHTLGGVDDNYKRRAMGL